MDGENWDPLAGSVNRREDQFLQVPGNTTSVFGNSLPNESGLIDASRLPRQRSRHLPVPRFEQKYSLENLVARAHSRCHIKVSRDDSEGIGTGASHHPSDASGKVIVSPSSTLMSQLSVHFPTDVGFFEVDEAGCSARCLTRSSA